MRDALSRQERLAVNVFGMVQYSTCLEFIVDNQLRDQLGLRERMSKRTGSSVGGGQLTNPNMYTKEVRVEITKLYHPR